MKHCRTVGNHRRLSLALLLVLLALPCAACGGETASPASTASASAATITPSASRSASPLPALRDWSPEKLRAALPGLLVARSKHPRLEIVSADGTQTTLLWRPPAGYHLWLLDCDPEQGLALVQARDIRRKLDEGRLVLLGADGTARWLDLPADHHPSGAVLLADGSLLCCSTDEKQAHFTELVWSRGDGEWQPVHTVGGLLRMAKENSINGAEPLAARKGVLLKTWARGGVLLPATWHAGTLTATGRPVDTTGWLSGEPLEGGRSVLMARRDEAAPQLCVDLVQVRWVDGRPQRRVIVKDGPQSSGHDSITLVGAGPAGSALVLGWRFDESTPEAEETRPHHLQRLDLDTGQLTVLPFQVRSDDDWLWLER
jgi:hypothetical protein